MACFYAAGINDTGYVDTLCNKPKNGLLTLVDDFIENHCCRLVLPQHNFSTKCKPSNFNIKQTEKNCFKLN